MQPDKILITGATGYIGHQLALYAAKKGYHVHALVRNPNADNRPLHPNITFFKGDIMNYLSVVRAAQGCRYIMHAAALAQMWHKDRSLFYRVNVEGTRHVLEAALHTGVQKLVFTSSCAVLDAAEKYPVKADEPRTTGFNNDYEVSKYCAEELVKAYHQKGLFTVVVRPSRVYGPGPDTQGNPINKLVRNVIRRGIAFMPADKAVYGNYAFIDDVVYGHFRALHDGINGQHYNLGGENLSYQKFFETIGQYAGKKIKLVPLPKTFLKGWAGFVWALHFIAGRHTNLTPKVVTRLFQNRAVCCQKSVAELGYNITPFQQGIQQTILHLQTAAGE